MHRILNHRVSRRKVLAGAALAGVGVAALRFVDMQSLGHSLAAPANQWPNALTKESGKVAHLLRRAGFGYSAGEFESAMKLGFSGQVEKLLSPTITPVPAPSDLLNVGKLRAWWLDQIVATASPLQEKMTLFWHGFLTTDYRKLGNKEPHMYNQNVLYREQGMGNFRTLLQATSRNPAMMIYLDLQTSRKGSPNENYARELMELFTMGPGNYTEQDVREAARALTGWQVKGPSSMFNPQQHDSSSKTFLGRTGNFGLDEVIDIILAQRATAPFVATKFARYFVMSSPPDAYVRQLADVLVKTKWDIRALLRAIFLSPEFVAAPSYRALVKSPTEYVASALRAVEGAKAVPVALGRMQAMDQSLFDPPTVAGWPSDAGWISSNTLLGRLNFAQDVVSKIQPLPAESQAVELQLDGSLSPQTAKVLTDLHGADHWYGALVSAEFQLK